MNVMFIVYHDLKTEARSQEILECAKKLGETTLVSYSVPFDTTSCKIIQTGNGKRKYIRFFFKSIKSIISIKPDIIILHDNYCSPMIPIICKVIKKPIIIYDSSELYIDIKRKGLNGFILNCLNYFEKKYINKCYISIAANEERANIMKSYFRLKQKPLIFQNIHKIEDRINYDKCNAKFLNLFSDNKKFYIFYAGGLASDRRIIELIDAVASLGEKFRLIIAGSATKYEINIFNNKVKKEKIMNVRYLGFVSRSELRYLITKSNVCVSAFAMDVLNNINCASGKLYESIFEGVPVITSENTPFKRICNDYNIGISNTDFKDSIYKIYNNYSYYKKNTEKYALQLLAVNRIQDLYQLIKKELNKVI